MNVTQRFIDGQGLQASAMKICQKSNRCTSDEAFERTSRVVKASIANIVREAVAPFDVENGAGTAELMKGFDAIYEKFESVIAATMEEEDVKALMEQVMARVAKDKPSQMVGTDFKWFMLWVGEVVLNNPTLNNAAQGLFEWMFGVKVDAQ